MGVLTNAQAVRRRGALPAKRLRLAALRRALERLAEEERRLGREVEILGRVTEVFEGVALQVHKTSAYGSTGYKVWAVGHDNRRYAEVYPNATRPGEYWGLHARTYGDGSGRSPRDHWGGCAWPKLADALRAAKLWVARGKVPRDTGHPE